MQKYTKNGSNSVSAARKIRKFRRFSILLIENNLQNVCAIRGNCVTLRSQKYFIYSLTKYL
jgi:hypothetical protein